MASIIPGYEYDIFISYRQKDNKYDGWVTEFVMNLKKELEATVKEEVTVYFDENPDEGIHETYNVDKSLEGKLKCLIFIPIVSQTYCDPKSYAWQNEFLVFNRMTEKDQLGKDIKLNNGNVSGRILPVKIHDIDLEDKALIEYELGNVLRSVDFIYKSSGVNRPLKPDDSRTENQNRTFYRDQINKIANAVKEIIGALKNGNGDHKILDYINSNEKSIAVLPFTDMSPGQNQEYLGDGLAAAIIAALSEMEGLKVIGRTSSFQFKGEKIDLRDIGQKLQVSSILEGSVQKSDNNIRVIAELIKVSDGSHIWSQKYNSEWSNVFAIQDEITSSIVKRLKMTLLENRKNLTEAPPTKNMKAYEMVLLGNYFINRGPAGAKQALEYFQMAIEIDPDYADAYLGLSIGYFFINAKAEMKQALDMAQFLHANEILYHRYLNGYYLVYEWNWEAVREEHEKLLRFSSSGDIAYAWYLAGVYGNFADAIKEMEVFLKNDPLNFDGIRNMASLLILNKQYKDARQNLMKIIDTDPNYATAYERMGYCYYSEGKHEEAIKHYEKSYRLSGNLSPKLEIVIALSHSGKKDEAKQLFEKILIENKSSNQKNFLIGTGTGPGYDTSMAMVYFSFEEPDEAFRWLDTAYEKKEGMLIGLRIDPIFDPFRNDPRFKEICKKMNFPDR